ncbi:unnamed protein product [Allacma fusca]|uniref:Peptidase S1 domain-containing protein n=1 Tax=Allacma fusca TaxID=39272 RepID=A0A8J2PCL0_9HEXA|nr:unnamed protein product [Allacma fusca]
MIFNHLFCNTPSLRNPYMPRNRNENFMEIIEADHENAPANLIEYLMYLLAVQVKMLSKQGFFLISTHNAEPTLYNVETMALLRISLLAIVLVAFFCSVSEADKYQYEDTIIIEPSKKLPTGVRTKRQGYLLVDYYGSRVEEQQQQQPQPQCYTNNGEPGVCDTLSSCYPVLYTAAHENGYRNLTNLALAEDLMAAAGPCSNNQQDIINNIICCPTGFRAKYPIVQQPPKSDPPRVADCGNLKVVGGTQAPAGTYPFMAALMSKGRQFCGGSLIDSRHILTAAHCVQHMTANDVANFRIYLGARNVRLPNEPGRKVYQVSRVLYNRGFSMQTLHDDIAIVRLAEDVREFNEKIQAICLSTGDPPYDGGSSKATLSGWGKQGQNLPQSPQLLQVTLPVLTNAACRAKYGSYAPAGITEGMVCAGGGGKDACQGDSGGPLQRPSPTFPGKTEQIGVVSWGIGCGTYPGVYTRVDKYRSWLDRARAM